MPTPAGTQPHQRSSEIHRATGLEKCGRIVSPALFVEICRKEETRLILKHRVNARHKRLAHIVEAGQVPANDIIGHEKKTPMRTIGAFDSWLFADPANPFVSARGGIAGFSCSPAFKTTRVYVLASSEERSKESDLHL